MTGASAFGGPFVRQMLRSAALRLRRCSYLRWLTAFALGGMSACTTATSPSQDAVFQVLACKGSLQSPDGEVFRILLQDPVRIREADALLSTGERKIVLGSLRAGDGGFNAPWSWHLDPASIAFPDVSVEVCDGCPSFIQNDLNYWLHLGQFWPWSADIIGRDR